MYDAINTSNIRSLNKLSGEQLLLLAVLGAASLKPKIDRELDRRARADIAGHRGVVPQTTTTFAGFAA